MSRSSKSRLYTVLGWAVFTLVKRQAKKKLTPDTGGGKGKKLLAAGAVLAAVGGGAYLVSGAGDGSSNGA